MGSNPSMLNWREEAAPTQPRVLETSCKFQMLSKLNNQLYRLGQKWAEMRFDRFVETGKCNDLARVYVRHSAPVGEISRAYRTLLQCGQVRLGQHYSTEICLSSFPECHILEFVVTKNNLQVRLDLFRADTSRWPSLQGSVGQHHQREVQLVHHHAFGQKQYLGIISSIYCSSRYLVSSIQPRSFLQ